MHCVFVIIKPLLEKTRHEAFALEFQALALNLTSLFTNIARKKVKVDVNADDDSSKTTTRHSKGGGGGGGTNTNKREKGVNPKPRQDKPGHKEDHNGVNENRPPEISSIQVTPTTDARLEGMLCDVITVDDQIKVMINKDHALVIEAMKAKPMNQMALNLLMTREIGALIGSSIELCEAVFDKKTADDLAKHSDDERRKRAVARILIDSIRAPDLSGV